jgi:hypothetical protein
MSDIGPMTVEFAKWYLGRGLENSSGDAQVAWDRDDWGSLGNTWRAAEALIKPPTIQAVSAEDSSGPPHLRGFAIGDAADIKAFFQPMRGYGLILEEVIPLRIPAGFAIETQRLELQKEDLELQLYDLEQSVNDLRDDIKCST